MPLWKMYFITIEHSANVFDCYLVDQLMINNQHFFLNLIHITNIVKGGGGGLTFCATFCAVVHAVQMNSRFSGAKTFL